MLQELVFAVRGLVKRPGYAVSVVLTLAIGIGATTLMFSLLDAALLRPLPFRNADRLVSLTGVFGPQRAPRGGSMPEIRDWASMNQTLQDLSMYDDYSLNLAAGAEVQRVEAEMVSASYFRVLGVRAALGRTFLPEEDTTPDKHPVVVISDTLWRRMFGADSDILQKTVRLNDRDVSIVGVMPEGFTGLSFDTEVWVPSMMVTLSSSPTIAQDRGSRWLGAIGRLEDGVGIDAAQRDLDRVASALEAQFPATNRERGVQVDSLRTTLVGYVENLLVSLFGGVVLFLIVACANVASLQLARAVSRRRELAVRLALGATRWHLARQLLAESLVLALVAGVLGTIAAAWGLTALTALLPPNALPRSISAAIDMRAVAFALAVSCLAAIAVALLPAAASSRGDLSAAMKEGERAAGPGLASIRRPSLQQGLVVAEIALAMTLLAAAGLMIRSLERVSSVPLGFEDEGVTVAQLTLPGSRYNAEQRAVFANRLLAEIRQLPLVRQAAVATTLPLTGNVGAANMVPDTASTNEQALRYYRNYVTPDFLSTLGIPVMHGRAFTDQDRAGAPLVAMINENGARRIWGTGDVAGRQFRLGNVNGPTVQIVGVVGNARFRSLRENLGTPRLEPDLYFPYAQRPATDIQVAVRTADASPLALGALQQAVNKVDGGLPVFRVRPLADAVRDQTSTARFGSVLFTVFSAGALLLAAVGLYGLIAYVVGLSRREIAIRLALGANARRVVALIVGNGMSLVALGVVAGAGGAYLAGRALRDQLFETSAFDLATIGIVGTVLLVVAFVAAVLPSRRAAHVEPQGALRNS